MLMFEGASIFYSASNCRDLGFECRSRLDGHAAGRVRLPTGSRSPVADPATRLRADPGRLCSDATRPGACHASRALAGSKRSRRPMRMAPSRSACR